MTIEKCKKCEKQLLQSKNMCVYCGSTYPILEVSQKTVVVISVIFLISISTLFYQGDENVNSSAGNRIKEDAISHMTQRGWPNTFKKWGREKFDYINKMQWQAAEYVLNNHDCNIIESLALSDAKSIAPYNIVYYAWCANGNKFYVSDRDL